MFERRRSQTKEGDLSATARSLRLRAVAYARYSPRPLFVIARNDGSSFWVPLPIYTRRQVAEIKSGLEWRGIRFRRGEDDVRRTALIGLELGKLLADELDDRQRVALGAAETYWHGTA